MKKTRKASKTNTKNKENIEKNNTKLNINKTHTEINIIIQIIKSESHFKLQIISIESYKTFINFLELELIEYKFHYSTELSNISNTPEGRKELNFIYQIDTINDFQYPLYGKYILFGNCVNLQFTQFYFTLTNEYKEQALKEKFGEITEMHLIPHYNLHELETLFTQNETFISYENYLDINFLTNNILTENEILILYVIYSNSDLNDIFNVFRALNKKDNKTSSLFDILLSTNNLIEHAFVKQTNNKYYLNISKDFLIKLCSELGYNI
ncbi:hypothetical protein CDIK_1754 [Cucumispora dikerogammari]|nr:hypothetical protein CDIK_1754 [Cucumispora dikerogammari]